MKTFSVAFVDKMGLVKRRGPVIALDTHAALKAAAEVWGITWMRMPMRTTDRLTTAVTLDANDDANGLLVVADPGGDAAHLWENRFKGLEEGQLISTCSQNLIDGMDCS